ncbi:MAG: RNA polymerase sigma factor [Bacteroidales bacterium]
MNPQKKIIKGLNKRNSKSLKGFFESFYPSLCVFARKYIQETDVAEDIAQDSFLVFWEGAREFENLDYLKGYLYKTVKNKCLNHLKLKGLHAEILKRGLDSEDYWYEQVLEEEAYRLVYNAVEALPVRSRSIIELGLRGYKNQEIAEELSVSINTVKTLKKHAYKTLREDLKDYAFLMPLIFAMFT